jgi:hypothetical protein
VSVLASACLFADGTVVAFDDYGKRPSGYQGRLADVRGRVLADAPGRCGIYLAAWMAGDVPVPREQ